MPIQRVSKDPNARTVITHFNIGTERPTSYPSEWFGKAGNDKPIIIVMPDKDAPRAKIHSTIMQDFGTGRLDHRVVVKFLQMEFTRHPGSPNEDWTSFNREICKQGAMMTLSNLVTFNEIEEASPLKAAGDLMPMDEIVKYVIALCSLYRLAQITRPDYRDQVTENVNKILATLGGNQLDIGNATLEYQKWLAYTPYTRMMAVIDMFLNEFLTHRFAQARLGTIVTRFKDCSALLSSKLIMDTLGLGFDEFALWIWTKRCADQYERVLKGGEEMDNPRSYAMYFMEFAMYFMEITLFSICEF